MRYGERHRENGRDRERQGKTWKERERHGEIGRGSERPRETWRDTETQIGREDMER